MFVAVTGITDQGQPLFCVNPVTTSVELKKAFSWIDQTDAQRTINESKEIYDLNAFVVEIIPTKSVIKSVEKPKELKAI
jgi:hypothetical protein